MAYIALAVALMYVIGGLQWVHSYIYIYIYAVCSHSFEVGSTHQKKWNDRSLHYHQGGEYEWCDLPTRVVVVYHHFFAVYAYIDDNSYMDGNSYMYWLAIYQILSI